VEQNTVLPLCGRRLIGWIVPTSLFACITLIRIVSAVMARRSSSGSISPVPSTGSNVTSAPRHSRNRQGAIIAGYLGREMCLRWRLLAKNTPFRARLLASLPPLVNTTSPCAQPSKPATWPRALSTISRAGVPAQCGLDGLPKAQSIVSRIATATSAAIGVLAL
jgi:hypothetical protein